MISPALFKSRYNHLAWFVPGFILGVTFLFGVLSEKIPIANGMGYHAEVLGRWVRDFGAVFDLKATSYQVRHIFPAYSVRVLLDLFGMSYADESIVFGFVVLHSLCYAVMALFWMRICTRLNLSVSSAIMGVISLVLNFSFKYNLYTPISFDIYPQMFAILLVYAWLSKWNWVVLLLIVANAFVVPQGMYTSAVFLIFPHAQHSAIQQYSVRPLTNKASISVMAVLFLPILVFMMSFQADYLREYLTTLQVRPTKYISQFLAFAFMCCSSWYVVRRNPFGLLFTEFNVGVVARLFCCILLIRWLSGLQVSLAAVEEMPWLNFSVLFKTYFWFNATLYPLLFLVVLVAYFGPILFYYAWYWAKFIDVLYRHGFALVLLLGVCIVRAIECEPRHLVDIFPIFLPFLMSALNDYVTRWHVTVFFATSFVLSAVWVRYNLLDSDVLFWQWYPCSFTGYAVQGALIIFLAIFVLVANRFFSAAASR